MKDLTSSVASHYTVPALATRILDALESIGKDVNALTVDDLAPVDGFHVRGRAATEELARLADVRADELVLDVGSGLGGTARYLAAATGCHVHGVDLTDEYCRVAEMLTARVGLGERVGFRQGDALGLPFEDASFDVAWTEHTQMNVADKGAFYGELARVLRPGGRLAFHDLFAGAAESPRFPVPWASSAAISHLLPVGELPALLDGLGFERIHWEDASAKGAAFLRGVLERVEREGWSSLGLHLLMGEDAQAKFRNVLAGLDEGRIAVVMAVLRRR